MTNVETDGLFEVIEIEVNTRCNLKCEYCPNSVSGYAGVERRMSSALFSKVCDELADLSFCGRISFHFYNEPLLRKDLSGLVREARNKVPMAFIDIYTNGDLLSDTKYKELLEVGADRFYVTLHNATSFPNREYQLVQTPQAMTLTGRGGLIDETKIALTVPCYAPSEMLTLRHDGTVVLCCEDAGQSHVVGNAMSRSLYDIWNDSHLSAIRRLLAAGRREKVGGICRGCTSRAHPISGTAI